MLCLTRLKGILLLLGHKITEGRRNLDSSFIFCSSVCGYRIRCKLIVNLRSSVVSSKMDFAGSAAS
jgi:hypothetical protein